MSVKNNFYSQKIVVQGERRNWKNWENFHVWFSYTLYDRHTYQEWGVKSTNDFHFTNEVYRFEKGTYNTVYDDLHISINIDHCAITQEGFICFFYFFPYVSMLYYPLPSKNRFSYQSVGGWNVTIIAM